MTSNKRKLIYRSLSKPQALYYLKKLKNSNEPVLSKISELKLQFSQENPNLPLMKKLTVQLLTNPFFKRLQNYLRRLSELNVQSEQKVRSIYKEIKNVINPMQQIQSGDYVPLHIINTSGKSSVQQILSSQINAKNVTIIPRNKRSIIIPRTKFVTIIPDKAKGKTKRKKNKVKTNKKIILENKTKSKPKNKRIKEKEKKRKSEKVKK